MTADYISNTPITFWYHQLLSDAAITSINFMPSLHSIQECTKDNGVSLGSTSPFGKFSPNKQETFVVKPLSECTEKELEIILNHIEFSERNVSYDLVNYVLDHFGIIEFGFYTIDDHKLTMGDMVIKREEFNCSFIEAYNKAISMKIRKSRIVYFLEMLQENNWIKE